ncbi:hypothetical protein PROFUN_08114 [Planoprotostelium fungivorum]|uniref:Uncharacterized protein n=1 Tax=Planoprotostelium fungivorum TaxID=1890364 RepID=A0A2P6NKF4_9EUKA|nr:hypothetical protein PROFUN_08114 [Planoprotostelium fungivorum]
MPSLVGTVEPEELYRRLVSCTVAVLYVHVVYTLTLMTQDNRLSSSCASSPLLPHPGRTVLGRTLRTASSTYFFLNFADPNNGHYGSWQGKDWTGLVQWAFTLCQPIVPGLVHCNHQTSVCRERSYSWWWPYYAYPTSIVDQSAVFDEPTVPGAIASFRQRGLLYGDSAIVDLFCDPTVGIEGGEVSPVETVDGVYKASWKLRQISAGGTKTVTTDDANIRAEDSTKGTVTEAAKTEAGAISQTKVIERSEK